MRDVFLVIMIGVSLIVSGNATAEWVSSGDNESSANYFDPTATLKEGSRAKMWSMGDFKAPQFLNQKRFMSIKLLMEYECKEEQSRTLYISLHSKNMAKGEVVHTVTDPGNWTPIPPASVVAANRAIACGTPISSTTHTPQTSGPAPTGAIYTGSGFFITSDGYFVTNHHVIKGAQQIGLLDVQGKKYEAKVVRLDVNNDLALLKVTGAFSALPLINSQKVKRGMRVITVGFPNLDIQGMEPKLSEGIISALSGIRDEPTVFQISVPIQPGNSGGPLVDRDGNVVGVIASKLSALFMIKNKGSVPENVNYAIKSNYLHELIQSEDLARKSLLPATTRPVRDLIDLSERVEKSVAIVFAIGKQIDLLELTTQCSQAAKEDRYPDAIDLCKQLAALGDATAQWFLGTRYFTGKGVSQDYLQAEKWFQLSAAQGNARAQFFLGLMYYDGNGVAQDYREALKWYRLAARQGNESAHTMLSLMYLMGDGAAKDYVRAYMWASYPAAKGDTNARKNREIAASWLTPSQISEADEMAAQCLQRNFKDCN